MLTVRAIVAYHMTVLMIALAYWWWRVALVIGLIDAPGEWREENGSLEFIEAPIASFGATLDAAVDACRHGFIHGAIQAGVPVRDVERAVRRVFPKEQM